MLRRRATDGDRDGDGNGDGKYDLTRIPMSVSVSAPAVAFVAMATWMLWGAKSTAASQAFAATPQFLIWLLILCAEAAFWMVAAFFVRGTIKTLLRIRHANGKRMLKRHKVVRLLRAPLIGIAIPPFLLVLWTSSAPTGRVLGLAQLPRLNHLPPPNSFPLAHYAVKTGVINTIGLLVGMGAILGIWITALAFQRVSRPADDPPTDEAQLEHLECFLALRSDLGALLGLTGTLVGLGTLSAGALRIAVLAANHEPYFTAHPQDALEFAPEYVLAYGLFFTGLVAIAFTPALLAMRAAGARLRDAAFPMLSPVDPQFTETVAKRAAFDGLLQTNLVATASFKAGAGILAPLATSLLTLLVPGSSG